MATKYLYGVADKLYKDVNGELSFVANSPITESIIKEHGTATYNQEIIASTNLIKLYIYEDDPSTYEIKFNYTILYKGQLILQDYDFNVAAGIKSLKFTATVNADDILKVLLSPDKGETWFTTEHGLVVECPITDINTNGMTHAAVNMLTKEQLKTVVGDSNTLRMAIYMQQARSNAKIKIDHIRLEYDVGQ